MTGVIDGSQAYVEVPNPALVALVGSHAYGTARPDSDRDFRGFYVERTERFWRLEQPQDTIDRKDPDITLYELAKFTKLCSAANPNVLEVLWVDHYQKRSWVGDLFIANRDAFSSRKALHTYGGYANAQFQKAQRGVGGSKRRGQERHDKFILHLYRLMEQGINLLGTGQLNVRVEDPEELWRKAQQPMAVVERDMRRMDTALRLAADHTDLPDEPDMERINEMLHLVRKAHVEGLSQNERATIGLRRMELTKEETADAHG